MAKPKGFELHKYYQHFGGSTYHIIATAKESDMWIIGEHEMAIAETREGSLQPAGGDPTSAANWYEVNKDIFINSTPFEEIRISIRNEQSKDRPTGDTIINKDLKHDYRLRVFKNGFVALFDLAGYYDEHGLAENIAENDPCKVIDILKGKISQEELIKVEGILFKWI